jgi:hypothetical protein
VGDAFGDCQIAAGAGIGLLGASFADGLDRIGLAALCFRATKTRP